MRTIKLILLVVILAVIVILALANRGPVTLNLLPAGMSSIADRSIELPLYVVGVVSVLVGMVLGYILEWLREHKHRRLASAKSREAASLNREVGRLRKEASKGEDEILALLRN
ncbi:lipopolysaccharide assembly protein LapA domain-containing protein [Amaricoccus sp.]|uniref:lipopolysaccharide assembly protein LapA domain-containing protein n=1 Tax=Amaricoccus sp. TaxID=1872485 RepID=UPI001B6A36F0|nr:lipopolysaccharide assembly protein LapA domain-containing protein [Amaricoccus sp.]MBP7241156.1 DUF1049 domain-containing protein [Amaricoccus sp.]